MSRDHSINRRDFNGWAVAAFLAAASGGCTTRTSGNSTPDKVWGKLGIGDGRFSKPRALAIDIQDRLYIVDMTARIQVFDTEGQYLRGWQTPEHANGRPTGLSITPDGKLLVADTHYHRVLTYTLTGELVEKATLGGTLGQGPGEFGFVTDAVRDHEGNYFVAEYGEYDRIQKFSPEGRFIREWGGHGSEPGEFLRPQHLEFDAAGQLWVADACNHRLQVFDRDGKQVAMWGTQGTSPGQLQYPYSLAFDGQGHVLVCEFGNHRVQKFTVGGSSVACWGSEGRRPGQLFNPWALALDSQGRAHVLDSNNHRVQRIIL